MATLKVFVLVTMDCEPPRNAITAHAAAMSRSGPEDYQESESSIQAYVELARKHSFPATIFAHPEIASYHQKLLLELEGQGTCLGLHLHPYKFGQGRYLWDLGAYSPEEQRKILAEASDQWAQALGKEPLYFRAGYFSANDNTFGVLSDLGFRGGSISIPGRILPQHQSIWAGAAIYPHRAHLHFRQIVGQSDFIEVPVSVDFQRPISRGEAGEQGYEWLYIPSQVYDHRAVVSDILQRFRREAPPYPILVTDSHNDQDYANLGHPARKNLELVLDSLKSQCQRLGLEPIGTTLEALYDLIPAPPLTTSVLSPFQVDK